MTKLDHKAFFWKDFDENKNPINPKECQIVFNPNDGGTISYLLDLNTNVNYDEIQNKKIEILYGHTSQGKPCTLYNLQFKNLLSKTSLACKIHELIYSIEYICYGGWIDVTQPLNHVLVRYSHLEGWFNLIEKRDIESPREDIFIVENIIVHNAKVKDVAEKDEIGFFVQNSWNTQLGARGGEVRYQLKNYLLVGKPNFFTFQEYIQLIKKLKNFFEIVSFYSHKNVFIEEFIIEQKQKDLPLDIPNRIEVLFQQDEYIYEDKIHIDYLFEYKDIKENFIKILNQWINNYDKNINEFTAFLNVITNKGSRLNIYSDLFQLISALEAYHRRNYVIDEAKQEEYNEYLNDLFKSLETCLNEKDTLKIIQSLQYNYQPNFRTRLKEMIEISDIKSFLPLNNKIYKSLNNYIYNLRNTIAHSKDIIIIDKKIEHSLEFLKIVSLLVMVKDISLSKLDMSHCRSKMNINNLDKKLRESFG